ncbi:hypothetical protein GUITHDRAFT_163539, partial [Guillardia theta CCMP2712]
MAKEKVTMLCPEEIPANTRYSVALKHLAQSDDSVAKLSFQELGDEGCRHFYKILSASQRVWEFVDISCNNIGTFGTRWISRSLASGSIRNLDISANAIGDEGCKILAEALVGNRTLRNLDLHACNIRSPGAISLAQALFQNEMLQYLNLRANYVCDEGASVLARLVRANTSL